jgi:hypothetical protein
MRITNWIVSDNLLILEDLSTCNKANRARFDELKIIFECMKAFHK